MSHRIAESRDWARIILAAGAATALVISALRGSLSADAVIRIIEHMLR